MSSHLKLTTSGLWPSRHRTSGAFTLVEVMVASVVLLFGLVSAITAMQSGLQAMDTSRNLTTASQLMQTEMERLRLKNWAQLSTLQNSNDAHVTLDQITSAADRFTCTRRITTLRDDMKEITLTAEWHGYDGRAHTANLITRYARDGLSDYISTAH